MAKIDQVDRAVSAFLVMAPPVLFMIQHSCVLSGFFQMMSETPSPLKSPLEAKFHVAMAASNFVLFALPALFMNQSTCLLSGLFQMTPETPSELKSFLGMLW